MSDVEGDEKFRAKKKKKKKKKTGLCR